MNHSIDQTKCRSFSATANPLFFKVLLPGFRRRLSIPPKFARKHLAHVNRNRNRAIIKSPLGKSWNVYVHVNEEGYFFKKGWRRFAQDHELCSKDLLVFEYEGCLRFSVKLFDSCACEKEYPPSILNGVEECESMIEIFEPSTNSPSGCTKQGLLNDEHRLKLNKWTTENFHVYSRNGISFFKTTIRPINISRSYMWIPPKFSAISGFQYRQEITMRDPRGREWQMKVFHHGTREKHDEFCGEWRNLVRVNALEVGDVCIFEFNPNRKDVIDVHMVKKQSESYLCRKEIPLSVPKTEVKQIPSTCLKRQASYEESEVTLKKRMRNSSQSSGSACLSRFPSFKISITSSKLIESYVSIPGDFVELNGLQNGSCVMLRDPKGRLWQVKLYHGFRNKYWSQLQGQWHEFVIANGLRSGDICVFKLIIGEKNRILDVCIINGLSAIKRIFSPLYGSEKCKILSETGCSTQGSSDSECKIKSSKKKKRTRKRNTNGVYRQNGISFFESTIKPANISYPYMWIPPKFADLNGFRNIREIMIRDPRSRLWHMKICHRNRRNERSFYGGWLKFTQVNGLEVGDVCVFEYNPYREKNIMDVHIVKKQSEPKPCEEETPYPAQRKTEKCEIGTKFENPIQNASFGQSEVELISIQRSGSVCSKHLPSFEISIKPSNLVKSYMVRPSQATLTKFCFSLSHIII
ncbi:putative B3 domain-containing protein [Acorus gramineus]|uniref:B3 domain-containing protein n=1 Tax=Acorus gramineus TaxID=55184 RepID=A0AAV9AVT7_ACOGR|nr:putative B3 domain-containing protein [Acorus gramineus]